MFSSFSNVHPQSLSSDISCSCVFLFKFPDNKLEEIRVVFLPKSCSLNQRQPRLAQTIETRSSCHVQQSHCLFIHPTFSSFYPQTRTQHAMGYSWTCKFTKITRLCIERRRSSFKKSQASIKDTISISWVLDCFLLTAHPEVLFLLVLIVFYKNKAIIKKKFKR